jgi:signal transduction histidine kinase
MRAEVEDRRGYVYLVGAAALFLPAVAIVNSTSFLLWALCPHAFILMPALRATVAVVLLNTAYVTVVLLSSEHPADAASHILPVAVLAVVCSAVFGTWARGVSHQNDERARLIEQLEDSRAQVARLSHEAGVTAERQRLAAEIHDTIAQGLSSVVMLIQAAEAELDRDPGQARRHLALAVGMARGNLGEARNLVAALTPAELQGSSLTDALRRLVERFAAETGISASYTSDGEPGPLSTAVEVVLLRAAQESLTKRPQARRRQLRQRSAGPR